MNSAFIKVNPQNTKFDLNPGMYGIFYEEINHSGEGGLYAELVQNRNFSNAIIPEGTAYYNGNVKTANSHREKFSLEDELPAWSIRTCGGASARMEPWVNEPRNPHVPNQLKLIAEGLENGCVELINSGYWGMAIGEEKYILTVIVRSEGVPGITVKILTQDNEKAGCASISGITSEFNKFTVEIDSKKKANKCVLAITPDCDGVLYFDYVSLFPKKTYKNRENGMNNRIAKMIADLKPGFMRFPGGCIVEGISLENAFNFKRTLGPVEDRTGCWNLWGYRRTDGIGYHEYLQFCEDIGAEALYVFNCGMSCQGRGPQLASPEQIDVFLQDAIDAIDYAVSPVTNPWGALRAKNGHPEPFNLKYVEIGNENWGDSYIERYNYFYNILKERYPEMKFIINYIFNNVLQKPDGYDFIDEHYYVSPEAFPAMANKFDSYDRNGAKIYLGEYAANQDVGIGNMAAAASEASFMINMERNGDLVTMASYAPLLCHMKDRTWPVNLICFEDDVVFGIPSYHVEKLFNNNMAKTIVETEVDACSFTNEAKIHAIGGVAPNGDVVVKAVNFSHKSTETKIDIAGGYKPYKAFEIAADNPEDCNSIESPENVCAKEVEASDSFVMKPYGVYVVRYSK